MYAIVADSGSPEPRAELETDVPKAPASGFATQLLPLLHAEVDAIVGYSWGGAVAHLLAASGDWEGPMLLVAPALDQVASRSRKEQGR